MNTSPDESIVLIGGEGSVALTLKAMLGSWSVAFHQADFSDGDGTMAAVQSASVILVAVEEDSAPALACCGILKEHDSGISAPISLVTAEPVDAQLRLAALRAGADDVISLEQNISVAAARLAALMRFHVLQSEAGELVGTLREPAVAEILPHESVRVLIIAEEASERHALLTSMLSLTATVATGDLSEALFKAARQSFDLVLVHGGAALSDALRICGQLRCIPHMRFVPLMALSQPGASLAIASEAARNADDCMTWPGETGDLILRSLLHLRRRRYLSSLSDASRDARAPSSTDVTSGLPGQSAFGGALKALRREADLSGKPLFMGIVQLSGALGDDAVEAAAVLIRQHLEGREIASRVEAGVFAILYPDRNQHDARAAIDMLRGRLEDRRSYFDGGYMTSTAQASQVRQDMPAIKTMLLDATRDSLKA